MVLRQRYYKIKGTSGGGGSTPVGIIDITENGSHDVTNYAVANVNVPIPEGYIMPSGALEVNENGTHNVKEYESVNVNVASSGGTANGLPLEVDSLPSSGTAVPNSGYVEKVYLNTSLSVDEVINSLSQITYPSGDIYYALANSDNSLGILFGYMEGTYMIGIQRGTSQEYAFISGDVGLGFVGWNADFNGLVEINSEVKNQISNVTIGDQNDKLTSLFSTTPFGGSAGVEGAIYKVGSETTAVPNSGYIEKVYFNTNLSVDEVVSIIESANLTYSGDNQVYSILTSENDIMLLIMNTGTGYAFGTEDLFFTSTDIGTGFIGWNPDFNGILEVNGNVLSAFGLQNEALKNLFSITPFSSDYYLCEKGTFVKLVKEVA